MYTCIIISPPNKSYFLQSTLLGLFRGVSGNGVAMVTWRIIDGPTCTATQPNLTPPGVQYTNYYTCPLSPGPDPITLTPYQPPYHLGQVFSHPPTPNNSLSPYYIINLFYLIFYVSYILYINLTSYLPRSYMKILKCLILPTTTGYTPTWKPSTL